MQTILGKEEEKVNNVFNVWIQPLFCSRERCIDVGFNGCWTKMWFAFVDNFKKPTAYNNFSSCNFNALKDSQWQLKNYFSKVDL